MARNTDLKGLVERFAADIEAAVAARVNQEFASRFDELRARILEGASRAPRAFDARRKPGPAPGFQAELKPCPVCKTPNKARRFSYLCENHRSEENLRKYKGAAKNADAVSEPATKAAKGPGRARAAKVSRKAPAKKGKARAAEQKG